MTPIARELLAPSLDPFGRSITLPAEAYADGSVFRWRQERFFDENGFCAGRSGDLEGADDRRVVDFWDVTFSGAPRRYGVGTIHEPPPNLKSVA